MNHEVVSQWMGKMQFNALVQDHTVVMDGPEKVGGENNGPIPKPLILTALSGCTGMDVVALLRKDKIELYEFEIKVTGTLSNTVPIQYTSIMLQYLCKGSPFDLDKTLDAIRLSQDKYCGVSSMLKKIMPVNWELYYNDELISNTPSMHDMDKL